MRRAQYTKSSNEEKSIKYEQARSEVRTQKSNLRSNKTKSRDGRSVGGKSVGGKSVGGKSVGGKSVKSGAKTSVERPKTFGSKSRGSNASKSPVGVKKLMSDLTHNKVKINEKTALLINGSEVLTQKGIKGEIHGVGLGFGTGRHTSGRRGEIYNEVV